MKIARHFCEVSFLVGYFIFHSCSHIYAQTDPDKLTIRGIYLHDFISTINGQPYRLTIALPSIYSTSDSFRYPVMYILDGDPDLLLAALIQRDMAYGQEAPEIILVGIGYQVVDFLSSRPMRTLDYTPTHDPKIDSIMTVNHHLKMVSGGAENFLKVVKEEIIPFIDGRYKTNQDRAIAGHSFGGLFVGYSLFHMPTLFNCYLLSSPSLDWGDRELFKEEASYYKSGHRKLFAKIFISAGSLEAEPMTADIKKLMEVLKNRNYKGLQISKQIFTDETHLSVLPFAISRGLRELYAVKPKVRQ